MSMKPNYYVMLGAAIPQDDFSGDILADEWLPYSEGHQGAEMSIQYGEGNDNYYFGKVLASADSYEDFNHKEISIDLETIQRVENWLKESLGHDTPAKLMLVCCYL